MVTGTGTPASAPSAPIPIPLTPKRTIDRPHVTQHPSQGVKESLSRFQPRLSLTKVIGPRNAHAGHRIRPDAL